jgi:uncharacterized protein YegP (UPF0339 family)
MSTTVPFAPDLLRDDTSLGTLSVVVVKAMTCGALVAMVTVVDRRVYVGIARSLHGSLVWAGTPPSGTVRDQCDDQRSFGGVMAGKFEVYKDRSGKFRFRLKASNGQVVATGEAYETKAAAKKGCESVVRAATAAPIEEVDS